VAHFFIQLFSWPQIPQILDQMTSRTGHLHKEIEALRTQIGQMDKKEKAGNVYQLFMHQTIEGLNAHIELQAKEAN
jgi:hypothetical protein